MKRKVSVLLTTLWIIASTLLLTYIWGGNPGVMPYPPESFGIWLSDLVGAQNAEDIGRLNVHYMLIVSSIVVSFVTFLGLRIWRYIQRKYHPR